MIKDYSKANGAETSRLLSKDLFSIKIDMVAAMQLRNNGTLVLESDEAGRTIPVDKNRKESLYATIYQLVILYENGHRIEVNTRDDVINIYSLITQHLHNVNYKLNATLNNIGNDLDNDSLFLLATLADTICDYNSILLTDRDQEYRKEQKQRFAGNIGVSADDLFSHFGYSSPSTTTYTRRDSEGNQAHEAVLRQAKKAQRY